GRPSPRPRSSESSASPRACSPARGGALAGGGSGSSLAAADLGERRSGDGFAPVPDAPEPLDLPVDGDQLQEGVVSVPPAKTGAGDDPGLLVEPVPDVAFRRRGARADPAAEQSGALSEGNLVEGLLRRSGEFERRRAGGRVLVRDELALRLDGRPGSLRCGLGDLPDGLLGGGRRGLRGRSRALRERDRRSRVRGRVLRLSILSVGAAAKREP